MPLRVLFVEDNNHKRESISSYLRSLSGEIQIVEAYSFSSGCRALEHGRFDLIVLDISMPTYDRDGAGNGGRFRTFGGCEIARKAARRGIETGILFVTQYEAFSDRGRSLSLVDLESDLMRDCGERFLGMIRYDSSRSDWKEEIKKIVMAEMK